MHECPACGTPDYWHAKEEEVSGCPLGQCRPCFAPWMAPDASGHEDSSAMRTLREDIVIALLTDHLMRALGIR